MPSRPYKTNDRLLTRYRNSGAPVPTEGARKSRRRLTAEAASVPAAGDIAQAMPKEKSDRIVINLIDTPVWRHITACGVHEFNRRYYEGDQSIYGRDNTIRALLEPSMKFAEDNKLTGDELLEVCEGAFEVDQHRSGSIQVSRDFIDSRLQPLMKQLEASTSENFRWSIRTVMIMVLFFYANYLQKNSIKRTELLG